MSQQYNRAIECAAYYVFFAVFRIKINAEGTFGWDFNYTAVQQRRATVLKKKGLSSLTPHILNRLFIRLKQMKQPPSKVCPG